MKDKKTRFADKLTQKKLMNSRDDNEILSALAIASKELDDEDLLMVTGGGAYSRR